jgi:adenosylcobinamide kinase / adenosylcobinamide-phosphate guanylyltransferase
VHFVTGGAFNGKSAWVKAYNGLNDDNCYWISIYRESSLPKDLEEVECPIVVLEGIELWVKELLTEFDSKTVRDFWGQLLEKWLLWERVSQGRKVILIGSDITKGIVPAEAADREWRDVTGRVFQDTVSLSERVDLIWYGINKTIKRGK